MGLRGVCVYTILEQLIRYAEKEKKPEIVEFLKERKNLEFLEDDNPVERPLEVGLKYTPQNDRGEI